MFDIRKFFIQKQIENLDLKIENFNLSYILPRNDIIELIKDFSTPKKVLDVGCSIGTLGREIKKIFKNCEVSGIELFPEMANLAKNLIDKVVIGDVETLKLQTHFEPNYFDIIIFADILEHLKNPWKLLKEYNQFLRNDGIVIASIPNVRHYSTIFSLVFLNYWPYRTRGINDFTHLRFFTIRNIKILFEEAGFKIIKIKRKYRIIEAPSIFNIFSRLFVIPGFEDFLTFQFLIVAKKKEI